MVYLLTVYLVLDVEQNSNFYTIHSRLIDLIAVGGPFRLIIILVIEITHFSCMSAFFFMRKT